MTQERFERIILDADTPLFKAVKSVEENYVLVTETSTGKVREYKTRTEFYGHHSHKKGGKLADRNMRDGTELTHEDFTYEMKARLKPTIKDGEHLEKAMDHFNGFIKTLQEFDIADGIDIAIGGTKCHRHDLACVLKYKGERSEKPLLFNEMVEEVKSQYGRSIKVCNGIEADDYLSQKGHENFKHFKKTGEWKYVLAFIDKDILMSISPSIDYYALGKGVFYQTVQGAAERFATQLLMGDKGTDNIPGLPAITDEIREKYSLKKTKGVGKATAAALLKDCSSQEMFARVAEAYKSYYPEPVTFTSWRGDELTWNWLDFLQETSHLVWMLRDDLLDIRKFLKRLGVEVDET